MRFEVGRRYRRSGLHAEYGGQRQGGISTPRGQPLIFLITGKTGLEHGYQDEWEESQVFRYFGEGQEGDMQFAKGNKAIRDHAADGRELHLFEAAGRGFLEYLGEVTCAGWEWVDDVPDTRGQQRRAIAFRLVTMPTDDKADEGSNLGISSGLDALRVAAMEAGPVATAKEARRRVYRRSAAVRAYVLSRAEGECEGCGAPAPFVRPGGDPYLEPHHLRRLSDGGPDDPRWVIAVCPNCHRRAHHSNDATAFNDSLIELLRAKEPLAQS